MIQLYKYIFYRAYFFCINVFKEKEFPYIWASFIVAFLIFCNIITLVTALEYFMLPERIETYADYNKYFALIFLLFVEVFFYWRGRYSRVVESFKNIKPRRDLVLKVISIFYILITVFLFFYLSSLVREYNLNN